MKFRFRLCISWQIHSGKEFMKYTSAMAHFCKTTTVFDAMQTIRDAGFDGLDFPISVYSRPLDSPLRKDDWRQWTREVRRFSDRIGLPVLQAHASWEQTVAEDFHFEPPYEIYARTMEACHILGCRNLVFHPVLYLFRVREEGMKERLHEWNVQWFRALLPLAEKFDLVIELENMFDYRHVQLPGDPAFPYTSAEDMLALCDRLDSDRVRICLDTGHANIAGQDVPAMIRRYGNRLAVLHLNDNFGKIEPVFEDLHLFPGYGLLDWEAIFSALHEIRYDGTVNMEPVAQLDRMPPELRVLQLRTALEILRYYNRRNDA